MQVRLLRAAGGGSMWGELLKIFAGSLPGGWGLGLGTLCLVLALGWFVDRGSLAHRAELLEHDNSALVRRAANLNAAREQSQKAQSALQKQLAEAYAELDRVRAEAKEREKIVAQARTRPAKKGEVLDDEASRRVSNHVRASLGGLLP